MTKKEIESKLKQIIKPCYSHWNDPPVYNGTVNIWVKALSTSMYEKWWQYRWGKYSKQDKIILVIIKDNIPNCCIVGISHTIPLNAPIRQTTYSALTMLNDGSFRTMNNPDTVYIEKKIPITCLISLLQVLDISELTFLYYNCVKNSTNSNYHNTCKKQEYDDLIEYLRTYKGKLIF